MKAPARIQISFTRDESWAVPIQPKVRNAQPRLGMARAGWKPANRRTIVGAALSFLLNRCRPAA
jgi:hypothetical protein